ncbi:GspH/FimT family pseudopilin [Thalassotalea agariperforans]
MKKTQGFTLFELLISIAIMGIITSIALPNLSEFLVKMRVDNQVSQVYRILLSARNAAIASEAPVTVCPLNSSNVCSTSWGNELSAFIDFDADGNYEPGSNEQLIKIKEAINSDDKLQFPRNKVTYEANGRLTGFANGTFSYCPKDNADLSRGVIVYRSGRAYTSSDIDNDGKEETRSGSEITCS